MYISLDLETTGIDPSKDSIIEFGAVKFDLNGEIETLQFLANPGIKLPDIITHITNIRDEDLEGKAPFKDRLDEVKEFIGDLPIVGHNIQFDTSFLRSHNLEFDNSEYDTHNLASTLLTGLPSYSLEILSKIFNLQHKEKHRALDDSIAAMELFIELTKRFKSLDPELLEKIQKVCERSNWKLKDYFLDLIPEKYELKDLSEEKEEIKASENPFYEEILNSQTSKIFEIPEPYMELTQTLAKKEDKDSYIAIPHQLFKEACKKLDGKIAKLDLEKNYISLKRLAQFEKKEFFEEDEISALIKYMVWSKETETGILSEIRLLGKERETMQKVNADPLIVNTEEEPFIKKAREKDKDFPAICSHNYIIEEKPKAKKLIILDFDHFTDSLNFQSILFLTIETATGSLNELQELYPENAVIKSLLSKCTILFGLVGIIFEKYNDKNFYGPRSEVNEATLNTKEWEEIKNIFTGLVETSKELIDIIDDNTRGHLQNWKAALKMMKEIFISPDLEKNFIWIDKDQNLNPIIRSAPLSLHETSKEIFENPETLVLVGESMDIDDDGKFIKTLYGLDPGLNIKSGIIANEALDIYITEDAPERETPTNKHIIPNFLRDFIEKEKGKTAIICTSRKQLEFLTLELSKSLKETKVVSQLTGSIGKVCEKFIQDPGNTIVLLTPHYWNNFKHYDLIDKVFLTKIPFAAPSTVENTISQKNYENSFMEFQVPKAIFALKKIINRIENKEVKKELIILDPRCAKKDYGKKIISSIEKLGRTKIVNLASLTS